MKITKDQLQQIIEEELADVIKESRDLKENKEMAKKQLDVLISKMQESPLIYAIALSDVESGFYMDALDSWLRLVSMLANRAGEVPVAQLASRIHTNWFETGKTLAQSDAEELARQHQGHI